MESHRKACTSQRRVAPLPLARSGKHALCDHLRPPRRGEQLWGVRHGVRAQDGRGGAQWHTNGRALCATRRQPRATRYWVVRAPRTSQCSVRRSGSHERRGTGSCVRHVRAGVRARPNVPAECSCGATPARHRGRRTARREGIQARRCRTGRGSCCRSRLRLIHLPTQQSVGRRQNAFSAHATASRPRARPPTPSGIAAYSDLAALWPDCCGQHSSRPLYRISTRLLI